MPRSIEDQVRKTYFSLRLSAAVVAFAFPVLLWLGGLQAGFSLRDSMSAYYHATPTSLEAAITPCAQQDPASPPQYPQAGIMRNWFVGILFAIGAILHANKGYTEKENIALSIAGLFAVCIALFPMDWACKSTTSFSAHGFFAVSFFVCIAFVSIVCSLDTTILLSKETRSFYRNLYWLWGTLMVVAPATAYCFNRFGVHKHSAIFWTELTGIYSFGLYWVTKTLEIRAIQNQHPASTREAAPSTLTIA